MSPSESGARSPSARPVGTLAVAFAVLVLAGAAVLGPTPVVGGAPDRPASVAGDRTTRTTPADCTESGTWVRLAPLGEDERTNLSEDEVVEYGNLSASRKRAVRRAVEFDCAVRSDAWAFGGDHPSVVVYEGQRYLLYVGVRTATTTTLTPTVDSTTTTTATTEWTWDTDTPMSGVPTTDASTGAPASTDGARTGPAGPVAPAVVFGLSVAFLVVVLAIRRVRPGG